MTTTTIRYGWSCSRCKREGTLPDPLLGVARYEQTRHAVLLKHFKECFTEEERAAGISGELLFAGRITTVPTA